MDRISLLKFLDEAILPVFLVFGSKLLGIFVLSLLLGFSWRFSNQGGYLPPFIGYYDFTQGVVANSLSSIVMLLVLAAGFTWVLFRDQHLREDKIHPKVSAYLHRAQMEGFIATNHEMSHQLLVWFSLSWLVLILVFIEYLIGLVVLLVLSLATTFTTLLTIMILLEERREKAFNK